MKITEKIVALDTDVSIFLVEASEPLYDPHKDPDIFLHYERFAMYMIFLYKQSLLRIPPTTKSQIKQEDQNKFVTCLLRDISYNNLDEREVLRLAKQYNKYHSDFKDCKILAEAEVSGCCYLLTFDRNFLSRLKDKTKIKIMFPSEFWRELDLSIDIKPEIIPRWDNPKAYNNWWKI